MNPNRYSNMKITKTSTKYLLNFGKQTFKLGTWRKLLEDQTLNKHAGDEANSDMQELQTVD